MIAATAVQEDVSVIGISDLGAIHVPVIERLTELLEEQGRDDMVIVAGGTFVEEDLDELREACLVAEPDLQRPRGDACRHAGDTLRRRAGPVDERGVLALVDGTLADDLGLGAQPPTPEWGALITDGRSFIQTAWWWPTFPGLALAVTVLGLNLLGDGLRDTLDPRMTGRI